MAASSGGAVGGSGQGANKKIADNSNKKKISRKEKTETEAAGTEPSSSPIKRKESTKLPSIHVTNFNAQKNSSNHTTTTGANPEHSPGTASTSDLPTGPVFKAPPSVIVSKKRKERPRRQESSPEKTIEGSENRHRKRSSNNSTTPGLDYRKSFGGKTEKFTRYTIFQIFKFEKSVLICMFLDFFKG